MMQKMISLSLSAFAIIFLIPFPTVAKQSQVFKQECEINQPTFQISKDKNIFLIDKHCAKKTFKKDRTCETSMGADVCIIGEVVRSCGLPTGRRKHIKLAENRTTPKNSDRPGNSGFTGKKANSNEVILSRADLYRWNQTRDKFIRHSGEIGVSPERRKMISDITRKLNESDGLMQRVAKLQNDPVKNKAELKGISLELQKNEKIFEEMNQKLQTFGDDGQLANIDMQNMLQKQQQVIQMMSTISKILHDTALAVIRKIG